MEYDFFCKEELKIYTWLEHLLLIPVSSFQMSDGRYDIVRLIFFTCASSLQLTLTFDENIIPTKT